MKKSSKVCAIATGIFVASLVSPAAYAQEAPDTAVVKPEEDLTSKTRVSVAKKTNLRSAISELKAKINDTVPSVHTPTTGTFTSGFGPRWGAFHNGIDIANSIGTPIYSITDGVVVDAGPAGGYGNWVRVKDDEGYIFTYGHMMAYSVSKGDKVRAGQQIAKMGNEGFSTGSHLHLGIEKGEGNFIDPMPWLIEHNITDWK